MKNRHLLATCFVLTALGLGCEGAQAQTPAPCEEDIPAGSYHCGDGSVAAGASDTAVGNTAIAAGGNSTAVGRGTTASAPNATALGMQAAATAQDTTAVGVDSQANAAGEIGRAHV